MDPENKDVVEQVQESDLEARLVTPSEPDIKTRILGTTLRGTIFVIMNSSLGAGLLALPLTFYRNGLAFGSFMIFAVGVISILSSYYIQSSAYAANASTLGDIAQKCQGKTFQIIVDITQILLNFGFCITYVIIINDQVPHVLDQFTGWRPPTALVSSLFGLLILFPLSSLKDIGNQKYPSLAAITFIFLFIILLIYTAFTSPTTEKLRIIPTSYYEILQTFPVLFFSFCFHVNIPKLFFEIRRQSTDKRPSHFATRRDKVLLGTIIACLSVAMLYIFAGVCGYWSFGSKLRADVLLNFNDSGGVLISIIRLAFALVVSFSFPIYGVPSIVAIWHFYSLEELPTKYRLLLSFAFVTVSVAIGTGFPDISIAFGLVGSTASVLVLFIYPSIFYLRTHPDLKTWEKILAWFIMVLAAIIGIVCTVITIIDAFK